MEVKAVESKDDIRPTKVTQESEGSKPKIQTMTISDVKNYVQEQQEMEGSDEAEYLNIKVLFRRQIYDVMMSPNDTIADLKTYLQDVVDVPAGLQKLIYKVLLEDDKTLSESGLLDGSKVMLVGSKLNDVLAVASMDAQDMETTPKTALNQQRICKQQMHKKILDLGVPEDAMPGIRGAKQPLPPTPLWGMLNKQGRQIRIIFKLDLQQIWLNTKERTDKISFSSIKSVISEPIEGHEEYHMVGLEFGTTESSRYWIYWVPTQYVDAFKDTILGIWEPL